MSTKITKNQTASLGKYSYQYVDIAQIHDYLESINARYIQEVKRIDQDDYIMTKRCFNDKWEDEWLQGCRIVDATLIGVNNPAQQQGSAVTYARRYSLLMAFGLATEDDDAQSLSVEKEEKEEKKASPKQIEILQKYYKDENLKKLLETNELEKLEDMSMSKASELISSLMKKGNK